jgi:hypothetical protein
MARKKRGFKVKGTAPVAQFLRAAQSSIVDGNRALQQGDCAEAVRSLAHAYQMQGNAEGYARALREVKGRSGSPRIVGDKRTEGLYRLKVKITKACPVPGR